MIATWIENATESANHGDDGDELEAASASRWNWIEEACAMKPDDGFGMEIVTPFLILKWRIFGVLRRFNREV